MTADQIAAPAAVRAPEPNRPALPTEPSLLRRLGPWVVALVVVLVVAAVAPPSVVSDYQFFQLNRVLAVAMAIAGLNLLLGYVGTISAGHGAIFGIGAYTTAILIATHGWPWPLALVASLLVCLAFGALLGLPALRLGGLNLGLITIAIAFVLPSVLRRFNGLTGGSFGIDTSAIVVPDPLTFSSSQFLFLVSVLLYALVALLMSNLLRGRFGRAVDAARTSPAMAVSMAVPTRRLVVVMFAVSAAVAGLAGGLSQLSVRASTPDTYTFLLSITLLTGAVVGGSRSFVGALIGAAFVVLVPDVIQNQVVDPASAGQWQQVIFAASLLLVMYFAPAGLAGLAARLRGRLPRPPAFTRRRSLAPDVP